MISEQQITDALKAVKYPGYSRDIVSFGIVKHIAANNGAVLCPCGNRRGEMDKF